jgi:signal transduction histidine kinase
LDRSERSVLTGIGVLRVIAWIWMFVVLVVQRHDLAGGFHAILAWALVGIAGLVTVWLAVLRNTRPDALVAFPTVAVELVVALALMSLDGLVFAHGHIGAGQSSLASSWPLASVMSAGVAFGASAGLASGIAMGVARASSVPLNGVALSSLKSPVVVSILSTLVIYALAGAIAGYVTRLLRDAADKVAQARAREEVSRTLHDGVLQTLALVERRSPDPQLASLAREQERELRSFLAIYTARDADVSAQDYRTTHRLSTPHRGVSATELEIRLRRQAGRFEDAYDARVDVLVAHDVPGLTRGKADALVGAVSEALVNSGKHGHATKATIYVEPGERGEVFCSVKDNGTGFDPATVREGLGLTGSVRGRVEGSGGRVEIDGAPGRGAEVRMWL